MQTEASAKKTTVSYAELYNVMQDAFLIIRELGLPDDIEHGITVIHRMIVAMNSLRVAMLALEAATVTSPIGWALIGIGFTASLISSLAGINAAINMRQR